MAAYFMAVVEEIGVDTFADKYSYFTAETNYVPQLKANRVK